RRPRVRSAVDAGGPGLLRRHALAQTVGRHRALADDVQDSVLGHLADDRADLGGTYVEPDDDPLVAHAGRLQDASLIAGRHSPRVDGDGAAAVVDEGRPLLTQGLGARGVKRCAYQLDLESFWRVAYHLHSEGPQEPLQLEGLGGAVPAPPTENRQLGGLVGRDAGKD